MGKQINSQLSRMKEMMQYGTNNDSTPAYSGIEYSKTASNGKTYGIVREGTKFYIKVANTANPLKEDYDYVGGFRNRKDYEYSSYANALKNFEMKMMSINESLDVKSPIIESWNPETKEELSVEATEKMKREIIRQRQIMNNANLIQESKNYSVDLSESNNNGCVDKNCAASQKNNIKKGTPQLGNAQNTNGDPFTCNAKKDHAASQKANIKKNFKVSVNEEDSMAMCDTDCVDDATETSIGDSAPFTCAPHSKNCKNTAKTEPVTEDVDTDIDTDIDANEDSMDVDTNISQGKTDGDFDSELDDEDDFDSDLDDEDDRLATIEDLVTKIADKLGVDSFEDDELYDDHDDESDFDEPSENDFTSDEDDYDDDDDDEVFESANYHKLMRKINEDNASDFGRHPAFQKEPIKNLSFTQQDKEGYYDMNDDSVYNESPFGTQIEDGEPFTDQVNTIADAITESITQILKKK